MKETIQIKTGNNGEFIKESLPAPGLLFSPRNFLVSSPHWYIKAAVLPHIKNKYTGTPKKSLWPYSQTPLVVNAISHTVPAKIPNNAVIKAALLLHFIIPITKSMPSKIDAVIVSSANMSVINSVSPPNNKLKVMLSRPGPIAALFPIIPNAFPFRFSTFLIRLSYR